MSDRKLCKDCRWFHLWLDQERHAVDQKVKRFLPTTARPGERLRRVEVLRRAREELVAWRAGHSQFAATCRSLAEQNQNPHRRAGGSGAALVQAHTPPPIGAIVTTKKPGPRRREPEPIDPEVEAKVKAWFAKNIRPPSE
jgi:hypothetical protein